MKPLASIPKIPILAAFLLLGAAYFPARSHVDYYMGTQAGSISCFGCHVDATGKNPLDRLRRPSYRSPLGLAVTPDASRLLATAQEDNSLLVIDLASRSVVARIPVESHPRSVVVSKGGDRAYVSNEWSDSVSVIDLEKNRVVGRLQTGNRPSGLALSPSGGELFVANWQADSISVLDLETGDELVRLAGGGSPNSMASSRDGSIILVTNELAYSSSQREQPVSEVTQIDGETRRVSRRFQLQNAHLIEDVRMLPSNDLAVASLVRPKNLLPVIHVARGWAMNNALCVLDLENGSVVQLILDTTSECFADPYGVAVTPDGHRIFVSHSGVDKITVIDTERLREVLREARGGREHEYAHRLDLSERFVIGRIPTGFNPKGLEVSPDGRYLFVAERLADRVLAIDVESLQPAFAVSLNESQYETVVRRGERLFNSASRTFHGQFSCRSCHPRNHTDRLQYDFEPDGLGKGIVDNRTLLGIAGTGPFKWNGKNTSLFMQCGIRFARILTRVAPFNQDELGALVAFMHSLPAPPNPNRSEDGLLTPSQQRGKALFERSVTKAGEPIPQLNRCISCHPPPLFTNRSPADVGSASAHDSTREFDTPHLRNIYDSAPYLHDGKAQTLHEIWTVYNPDDTHGYTKDMSNKDLNDLIEYLRTL